MNNLTEEERNNGQWIGIEVQGVYDGVLFWANKVTGERRIRFERKWYDERKIDIDKFLEPPDPKGAIPE